MTQVKHLPLKKVAMSDEEVAVSIPDDYVVKMLPIKEYKVKLKARREITPARQRWLDRQREQGDATRERILDAIMKFWKANGYSPANRDIMAYTGISSTSVVSYHLGILNERGDILWRPGIPRSITTPEIKAAVERIGEKT